MYISYNSTTETQICDWPLEMPYLSIVKIVNGKTVFDPNRDNVP